MRGEIPDPDIITDSTVDTFGRTITTEALRIEPEDLEQIFGWLGSMAQPHVELSDGGLAIIEAPKHLAHHTMGEPIPTEDIEPIASQADGRNKDIQIAVDGALWRAPVVLPSIYEAFSKGLNVGLCFSHNTVQDVPLGFGAILTQYNNHEIARQRQGDPKIDYRRGMIISQMLKRVGIRIGGNLYEPADNVMTMLADDVWSTITTGRSARELRKKVPEVTNSINGIVKDSVGTRQDEGKLFLAASLSGSTMKQSESDPDVYNMDGATDGTMQMALHENMRWLFMALLLEPNGVVRAEFSGASEGLEPGELRKFDTPEQVNAALDGLADTATAITSVTGRRYVHVPKKTHRLHIPGMKGRDN